MDLSVEITYPNGKKETYSTLEEASLAANISESAIKIRCNKARAGSANKRDKIHARWVSDSTFRSYNAKKSKQKGSNWEYELRDKFKELGFEDCVTSRGESKRIDNSKIDIISDSLPFYCQAKNLQNNPSYWNIESECPLKDKPFVVCWKKSDEQGKALAMVPIEFFYELLKIYRQSK